MFRFGVINYYVIKDSNGNYHKRSTMTTKCKTKLYLQSEFLIDRVIDGLIEGEIDERLVC